MILSSSSKSTSTLKLPNLFALFESTPRFIRGLNWKVDNDSTPVTIYDEITKNYVSKEGSMHINDVHMQICKINKDSQREDSPVFNMVKQLEKTALPYFHTYDHLVEKESHQHHMFSQIDGGYDGKFYDLLHNYHCRNTRGGHHNHKDHWMMTNMMNYDRTFTRTDAFIYPSSYYIGTGETNGWKDTNYLYYNFNGIYKGGYFKKFTPIPNLGLLVFNASIFNNIGEADSKRQRGTLTQIENAIDSNTTTYFYKDGQSTTHYLNAV